MPARSTATEVLLSCAGDFHEPVFFYPSFSKTAAKCRSLLFVVVFSFSLSAAYLPQSSAGCIFRIFPFCGIFSAVILWLYFSHFPFLRHVFCSYPLVVFFAFSLSAACFPQLSAGCIFCIFPFCGIFAAVIFCVLSIVPDCIRLLSSACVLCPALPTPDSCAII